MSTSSDIITIDNLSEKLPLWSPTTDQHTYAIVDMGSNGIRFSITSLAPPAARLLKPIYSTRASISLFEALTPAESGLIFPDETIEQVASTLAHFVRLATIHNVPKANIMIIATEAMRRAANSAVMLGAIARSTGGLGVNILEPAVETLLGAVMGSRSGLADVKGGALFLDLGGGSVQMTYVDTESDNYEIKAARAGQSLPYGAAKLTRILQEQPDGIKAQEIERLMIGIRDVYARLCSEFPTLQKRKASYEQGGNAFVDLYMCGGGFRGYGSMLMHDDPICPYPISSISTYTVEGARFKQVARMRQLNEQENGKIFGLSKRRRRQFPAIATVVDAVVAAVPNIGYVTFCRGSNREGALLMKLPKEVRECNPLEVLADVNASLKPPIDAVLQALHTSLPHGPEFSKIPTVFNRGLGSLFVREAWKRHGYDEDTNASFVIHDAICRDSNSPGLTHLSRAILAAALSTRWGGNLGPSDAVLLKGLGGILERHHPQTAFWAKYTGAVAALVATLFPVLPSDPALSLSLRFNSSISRKEGKKDKVVLKIEAAPEITIGYDLDSLAESFESTCTKGDEKSPLKVNVQFVAFNPN